MFFPIKKKKKTPEMERRDLFNLFPKQWHLQTL